MGELYAQSCSKVTVSTGEVGNSNGRQSLTVRVKDWSQVVAGCADTSSIHQPSRGSKWRWQRTKRCPELTNNESTEVYEDRLERVQLVDLVTFVHGRASNFVDWYAGIHYSRPLDNSGELSSSPCR